MYNKRDYRKTNDKKLLHKIGKRWVTVSIAMLTMLSGNMMTSLKPTHASAKTPKGQTQEQNAKEKLNQTLQEPKLHQRQSSDATRNEKPATLNDVTSEASDLHNKILAHALNTMSTHTNSAHSDSVTRNSNSASNVESTENNNSNQSQISSGNSNESSQASGSTSQSASDNEAENQSSVSDRTNSQSASSESTSSNSASESSAESTTKSSVSVESAPASAIKVRFNSAYSAYESKYGNEDRIVASVNAGTVDSKRGLMLDAMAKPTRSNGNTDKPTVNNSASSTNASNDMNTLNLGTKSDQARGWNFVQHGIDNNDYDQSKQSNSQTSSASTYKVVTGSNGQPSIVATPQHASFNSAYLSYEAQMGSTDAQVARANSTNNQNSQQNKKKPILKDGTNNPFTGSYTTGTYDGLHFKDYQDNQAIEFTGGIAQSDLSNFLTNSISDINNATAIKFDDDVNTSKVTNMSHMFATKGSDDSNINYLDLGNNFDTSKVTNMSSMFRYDENLHFLNLGGKFDTSKVTNMSYMFSGDENLPFLSLGSKFDTSKVTNMSYMFASDVDLQPVNFGDKFDTSNVSDMSGMFDGLEDIPYLDLGSKFDTSKVTNMSHMFSDSRLESVNCGDNFDTSHVTDMSGMFANDKNLRSVNLGDNFNTSQVTDMSNMFVDDSALKFLNLGNNFDTSDVTNMSNMFEDDSALRFLNLGSKFNTNNVKNMNYMFESDFITLTIQSYNTKLDNETGLPPMYKETGQYDDQDKPYTWGKPYRTSDYNIGTFTASDNRQVANNRVDFIDSLNNNNDNNVVGSIDLSDTSGIHYVGDQITINQSNIPKGYQLSNNNSSTITLGVDRAKVPVKYIGTNKGDLDVPVVGVIQNPSDSITPTNDNNSHLPSDTPNSSNSDIPNAPARRSSDITNENRDPKAPGKDTPVDPKDAHLTFYVTINDKDSKGNLVRVYTKRLTVGGPTSHTADSFEVYPSDYTTKGYSETPSDKVYIGYFGANNLSTDRSDKHSNNHVTWNYIANPQKATITYSDQYHNIIVPSDTITGHTDSDISDVTKQVPLPAGYSKQSDIKYNYHFNTPNNNPSDNSRRTYKIKANPQTVHVHFTPDDGSQIPSSDNNGGNINGYTSDTYTPSDNLIPKGYEPVMSDLVNSDNQYNPKSNPIKPYKFTSSQNQSDNIYVIPDSIEGTATLNLVYNQSNGKRATSKETVVLDGHVGSYMVIHPSDYEKDHYDDNNRDWIINTSGKAMAQSGTFNASDYSYTYNPTHTFTYNATTAPDLIVKYVDVRHSNRLVGSDIYTAQELESNPYNLNWILGQTYTFGIQKGTNGSIGRHGIVDIIHAPNGYQLVNTSDHNYNHFAFSDGTETITLEPSNSTYTDSNHQQHRGLILMVGLARPALPNKPTSNSAKPSSSAVTPVKPASSSTSTSTNTSSATSEKSSKASSASSSSAKIPTSSSATSSNSVAPSSESESQASSVAPQSISSESTPTFSESTQSVQSSQSTSAQPSQTVNSLKPVKTGSGSVVYSLVSMPASNAKPKTENITYEHVNLNSQSSKPTHKAHKSSIMSAIKSHITNVGKRLTSKKPSSVKHESKVTKITNKGNQSAPIKAVSHRAQTNKGMTSQNGKLPQTNEASSHTVLVATIMLLASLALAGVDLNHRHDK